MFVLTLLLQDGLGQPPLRAGLEAGPLALAFTTMSILGPRLAARLGPWSITLGAGLDVLGTIALVLTGVRYGGHLTGWDLAPATAIIGLGQGMALPSLIGAALSHVPPGAGRRGGRDPHHRPAVRRGQRGRGHRRGVLHPAGVGPGPVRSRPWSRP